MTRRAADGGRAYAAVAALLAAALCAAACAKKPPTAASVIRSSAMRFLPRESVGLAVVEVAALRDRDAAARWLDDFAGQAGHAPEVERIRAMLGKDMFSKVDRVALALVPAAPGSTSGPGAAAPATDATRTPAPAPAPAPTRTGVPAPADASPPSAPSPPAAASSPDSGATQGGAPAPPEAAAPPAASTTPGPPTWWALLVEGRFEEARMRELTGGQEILTLVEVPDRPDVSLTVLPGGHLVLGPRPVLATVRANLARPEGGLSGAALAGLLEKVDPSVQVWGAIDYGPLAELARGAGGEAARLPLPAAGSKGTLRGIAFQGRIADAVEFDLYGVADGEPGAKQLADAARGLVAIARMGAGQSHDQGWLHFLDGLRIDQDRETIRLHGTIDSDLVQSITNRMEPANPPGGGTPPPSGSAVPPPPARP